MYHRMNMCSFGNKTYFVKPGHICQYILHDNKATIVVWEIFVRDNLVV